MKSRRLSPPIARAALSLVALLPLPAAAQTPLSVTPIDCDPALMQSYAREQLDNSKRFALLQLVTRDNYERAKAEIAAVAVGGATVGATGNFDEFSDRRQKEYGSAGFRYSADDARSWLATSTTGARLAPYIACLRARPGFTAWIDPDRSDKQQATVRVVLKPMRYDGNRRLRITWHGIYVDEPVEESTTLVDGEERYFSVRRAFDEPFQADVYLDRAYALELHIPYAPGTGPRFTPARAKPPQKP